MRLEICAAVTLLVGNVYFLEPEAAAPRAPAPRTITVHREHNVDEAAQLAALWMAHNAGYHPPACDHFDPLAVLDADVDPTPGREHVIGNRRYGVAMYSERGFLIARMDPIGCTSPASEEDQSISLGYQSPHLVVRARSATAEAAFEDAHVAERRDDKLVTVAIVNIDTQIRDKRQVEARMSMQPDRILVKYHGRERRPGATTWSAVDEHCTLSRTDDTFVPDDPKSPCAAPIAAR